jgi:Fur family transcriptional regulator, ferric uptake regulator
MRAMRGDLRPADTLIDRLSKAGCRLTAPRRAVVAVIEAADQPMDCADICAQARKLHAQVGLATVYRTLDMLHEIAAIRRTRMDGRLFVVPCRDQSPHFHMVCENCHAVIELQGAPAGLIETLASQSGFAINPEPIEVRGLCSACRSS